MPYEAELAAHGLEEGDTLDGVGGMKFQRHKDVSFDGHGGVGAHGIYHGISSFYRGGAGNNVGYCKRECAGIAQSC